MSRRTAARLAWSIWALAVLALAGGLVLNLSAMIRSRAAGQALSTDLLFGLAFIAYPTVGAVIASRRPGNRLGWVFCAVTLVFLGSLAEELAYFALVVRPGSLPGGVWLAWLGSWIGNPGTYMVFTFTLLLFPTGRPPSPRWRPLAWLAAGWILLDTILAALLPRPIHPDIPGLNNPLGIAGLAGLERFVEDFLGLILVGVASVSAFSVILRYRQARTEERQQIKWFAYAASALILVLIALILLGYLLPVTPALDVAGDTVIALALAAVPITVGVAILKHRLFDIDLIIRRSLIYAILTALLALVYFASVAMLQAAFATFGGEQSQIAIVASTLAIAALFSPLRRRVQALIDRRFYRRKYDATRTLAEFASTARDETDLDRLTGRLVAVVDETIQPTSVSLWLQPTAVGGHPTRSARGTFGRSAVVPGGKA